MTALEGGALRVDERVDLPSELTDLPRVGTVLELKPGLEQLEWFGTGPHETYPDRKRGGLVGRWRTTVTDAATQYIRPQENGGRADVRWLALTRDDGTGIRIELDAPSQVSATHYRATDLATRHPRRRAGGAPRDGRPSRRGAPRAGHGQLRAGHASRLPGRTRDLPLELGPRPGRGLNHADRMAPG